MILNLKIKWKFNILLDRNIICIRKYLSIYVIINYENEKRKSLCFYACLCFVTYESRIY